jgi:hypothetical protein
MRHDIVQRQNPLNVPLVINDRKPSNFVYLHRLQGDGRVIVSQAGMDVTLSHFANRDAIGGAAPRREGDTDVTISDHAGDPAFVVHNGQGSAIAFLRSQL